MKLDPELIQYLTKDHFRVLTAVEMGMKNHEYVPNQLIESLSGIKRSQAYKILQFCLKHKMVMHTGQNYDGYALTNMGYDYLVLNVFIKRKIVKKVGLKIGMGKESDIYLCETDDLERPTIIVKFARLGRTSFRTVKQNRDYIKAGHSCNSWLYLSRLASLKEFAFMKALYERGFPTPIPIDANRHGICMSLIDAYPMTQVSSMPHPAEVYHKMMDLIVKLAQHGLVHGDFNEFNMMIDDNEKITMIDFPQMISTSHKNAQFYFQRDVKCVQDYFKRNYGLQFEGAPVLDTDIEKEIDLDQEVKASGFIKNEMGKGIDKLEKIFNHISKAYLNNEQEKEEDLSDDKSQSSEENMQISEELSENQISNDQEEEKIEKSQDESSNESDSEEQVEQNENRKVRFAETYNQRVTEQIQKNKDENEEEQEKKEEKQRGEKKHKKKVVNEEYVKQKVKEQLKQLANKNRTKHNKNKDRTFMKQNHDIKESLQYD